MDACGGPADDAVREALSSRGQSKVHSNISVKDEFAATTNGAVTLEAAYSPTHVRHGCLRWPTGLRSTNRCDVQD